MNHNLIHFRTQLDRWPHYSNPALFEKTAIWPFYAWRQTLQGMLTVKNPLAQSFGKGNLLPDKIPAGPAIAFDYSHSGCLLASLKARFLHKPAEGWQFSQPVPAVFTLYCNGFKQKYLCAAFTDFHGFLIGSFASGLTISSAFERQRVRMYTKTWRSQNLFFCFLFFGALAVFPGCFCIMPDIFQKYRIIFQIIYMIWIDL